MKTRGYFSILRSKIRTFMVAGGFVLGCLLLGLGCGEEDQPQWKMVKVAYTDRAECVATTYLAKVVLEDQMDLTVQMTEADLSAAYASLSNGKNDVFLGAWLPVTQGNFMRKYGNNLLDLGINYAGARTGFVVPAYVSVDSVQQLAANKAGFGGRIIGVDGNSGMGLLADSAIRAYNLEMELVPTSAPAMAAALGVAINNNQWLAATGWQPHWMFDRWELKFLVDTLNIFGTTENIHTIARRDIRSEKAEVAAFFERYRLDQEQLSNLMAMIESGLGGHPEEAARAWMVLHMDVVRTWTGATALQ